jgi:hypothetical protein
MMILLYKKTALHHNRIENQPGKLPDVVASNDHYDQSALKIICLQNYGQLALVTVKNPNSMFSQNMPLDSHPTSEHIL